ncbi:MAG: DUF72 domain-containing protein [Deltaproteobacteria bacterium]|nr:DUF72 domain-containing protein [Deltaproteobacteria bacterium]
MKSSVFIGTSGWNYKHWANGRFYPKGLGQKDWLLFYAGQFGTVELNNTFYRLPSPETFGDWAKTVPASFIFATKASRFITHMKKLKDPEESVSRFMAALSRLGNKRGPILFQLPPQMKADPQRLKGLQRALSRKKGLRVALEFRHESWLTEEIYRLIEAAGWTVCLADAPKFEKEIPLVGPFCYIRRHGATAQYASCYSDEQLAKDAEFIINVAKKGKDVYIYFNNDAEGYAIKNALTLLAMIPDPYLAPYFPAR